MSRRERLANKIIGTKNEKFEELTHLYKNPYKFKAKIEAIKTKISTLKQVRIIPQSTCFVVEIVFEREVKKVDLVNDTWLSIDLGLNNLVTTFNNIGEKPFIINRKSVKSINQYYNKKKAKLMSYIADRGTSKRILSFNPQKK